MALIAVLKFLKVEVTDEEEMDTDQRRFLPIFINWLYSSENVVVDPTEALEIFVDQYLNGEQQYLNSHQSSEAVFDLTRHFR